MAKDEDLSLALGLVTVRSDPEDQPEDEVADREEHRRMIQSSTLGDRNDGFRPLHPDGLSLCRRLSGNGDDVHRSLLVSDSGSTEEVGGGAACAPSGLYVLAVPLAEDVTGQRRG
jgi:hypothetical protein